jgi:hypothetical protein
MLAGLLAACAGGGAPKEHQTPHEQVFLGSRSAPLITDAGLEFRDPNRNGVMDGYEDWRLRADARKRLIGQDDVG